MATKAVKTFAIIVAAGSGTRMKSSVPKQFHLLSGKPIVHLTIQSFAAAIEHIHIILVVSKDHLVTATNLVQSFSNVNEITITTGGATRFESVKNGLRLVPNDSIVFVHDAVRCLVTAELIRACFNKASVYGNAVPATFPVDSIRLENEAGNKQIDRRNIRLIQTPQTFKSELLKQAYQQPYVETFTDDASVVEAMGERIHLVEGEATNIKITLPIDLIIAEEILKERQAALAKDQN